MRAPDARIDHREPRSTLDPGRQMNGMLGPWQGLVRSIERAKLHVGGTFQTLDKVVAPM